MPDNKILNIPLDSSGELEMLRFAVNQAAIVAITDVQGTIINVNDKFCKTSKYSREELLGQNHRILKSGHHQPEFYHKLWETISSGDVWVGQLKNRAKDGSYYWVHTTIIPFVDETKKIYQYLSIRFDITTLKELEQSLEAKVLERTNDLNNANKKINEMMDFLSVQNKQLIDFCNIVSHNLRAPLVNMSILTDFIENSTDASEQKLYAEKLKPVITSLNEVFSELVESLQIQQDKDIGSEKINVADCLKRVLGSLQPEIDLYQAHVEINTDEAPIILYPPKYLTSILSNLISNALKYNFPGRKPAIAVETKRTDASVLLSVKDNGLGIDLGKYKSQLFKIRKTFHQHPDARGFGLFITKTQIDTMGGKIWVESIPDTGSTFFIEFKNQNI